MHLLLRVLTFAPRHFLVPLIFLAGGWYGGAKYGAPDLLIRAVDGLVARAEVMLSPLIANGAERGGKIAADAAAKSGDYVVGTVEQMLEELAEAPPPSEQTSDEETDNITEQTATESKTDAPNETITAPSAVSGDSLAIALCGGMRVSNPPRANADGIVRSGAEAQVRYKGASLLLMPATNSCLSSGYGPRGGKIHRGVDYFSDTGGDVLAAGDGVIVEAVSRSDYGNMIVIDHGGGVLTRYAHLGRFAGGVREGVNVSSGQKLGPIGKTGATGIVHLHYELLTGDYNTNAKLFGLDAVDPFSL